jgi:hypothetical protein
VTIDLSRPAPASQAPTRRLVLRIATPDGSVLPPGTLTAYAYRPGEQTPVTSREVAIEKGRATFDAPVPARVTYQLRSMVGYWLQDGDVEIEPGGGDKVIDLLAVPAGAIAGEVLDHDGKPATGDVTVTCRVVEAAPGQPKEVYSKTDPRVDARGRFFISPLPLGGSYAVIAARGHNRKVSAAVRLDESKPSGRITVELARDAAVEGRVIGLDGRPLAGAPVTLELVHPTAGTSWAPPTPTDVAGRFRFDDLSSEFDGYRAIVNAAGGYQPNEVPLKPGGPPVEIRPERGHVIEGRVLDAKTGWPIPGVRVYAERPTWIDGRRNSFEAEEKADEQGRFRISSLPEGSWKLNDRDGLEWEQPHKTHVFGVDGPEPVEIRATLPSWSRLKPAPPAAH